MGHLLYFAYDHRMDESTLNRIAPGTELFGPSHLPGHTLDLSANGDPEPVTRAGDSVWGVLWMVPAEHLAQLDHAHGVDTGRRERTTVRIISPAGPPAQVICYRRPAGQTTPIPPDTDWALLLCAAKRQKLPADHQRRLARLAADAAKNSR
ncbi:MAG: gamma-glutamylcyclotransferase family protein [Verrucomicrobiota bacterium]